MKLLSFKVRIGGETVTKKKFAFLPTILNLGGKEKKIVWFEYYNRTYFYGTAYGWKIHQDSLIF